MAKSDRVITLGKEMNIRLGLDGILEEAEREKTEEAEKIFKEVARTTRKKLKSVSPRSDRKGKHYADGWSVKWEGSGVTKETAAYIVHNRIKPGLTHLLEYGHTTNKGTGRGARPHIAKVEQEMVAELMRRLEAEL